jgi:general secretion pathway protein A
MYHHFYHLKHDPFGDAPDPDFLFLSPSHTAALQAILRSLEDRQGLVAILGEAGLGKTTLLRTYLAGLEQRQYKAVHIFYPKISPTELQQTLARECGLTWVAVNPVEGLSLLQRALLEAHKHGRTVMLVIDDVHDMPVQTLEGLLQLASLQTTTGEPLLHIVLAGLPEFWRTLRLPQLQPLKKRLARYATLAPLTSEESLAYIRQRLAKVLVPEEALFMPEALKRIIRHGQGNPRVLNALCANVLITGAVRRQKRISPELVQEVLANLGAKRARSLGRWGGAYAAGLLLLAGVLGGVQSGWLARAVRSSLELARLTRYLPGIPAGQEAQRAAETEPELRVVTIRSSPEAALVTIDSRIVGRTPLTVQLDMDVHIITVEKPGYRRISYAINLRNLPGNDLYYDLHLRGGRS